MEKSVFSSARSIAKDFLSFNDSTVTPYHVIETSRKKLISKGFKELYECENWELSLGGKYFFTRNNSSMIAFTIGSKFSSNDTGFKIIVSHSDVPCLRLAPISKMATQSFKQLCVTTYGGSMWHSWFDRELTMAGRVIFKEAKTESIETKLFHIKRPLMKIPNLAIHLLPPESRNKFDFNKENHLKPIISSEIYEKLLKETSESNEKKIDEGTIANKHSSDLLKLIRKDAQLDDKDKILDLDAFLFDCKPGTFFGLNEEFISCSRIDNLLSTYTALNALIENGDQYIKESSFIDLVAFFDHEECGSVSALGADSSFLLGSLQRIFTVMSDKTSKPDGFQKALHRSFLISADMSHSMNPNYAEKHQQNHRVKINHGVVIKTNNDQRNATDAASATLMRVIAEINHIPIQDFIVKNDAPVRVTIGPIISSKTGIKSVDLGAPQLSMHSIRESAGILDILYYDKFLKSFFKDFEKIKHNLLKK